MVKTHPTFQGDEEPKVMKTEKLTDGMLVKDMGRIARSVAIGEIKPSTAKIARQAAYNDFLRRTAHRDLVAAFNDACPVGQAVTAEMGNGVIVETVTASPAEMVEGYARIKLQGFNGYISLSRVKASQ